VPLDLVGIAALENGGLGEVPHRELAQFEARYRFFFNPIRYTSLGLAVCEAMMAGLPVIGLATTEMSVVIENGVSGFVDTDPDRLVEAMMRLLGDREQAYRLGRGARAAAQERFGIRRFAKDWDAALRQAAEMGRTQPVVEPEWVMASSDQ
jgi:glycosyltransferase involved in cell wall biosynthesis